MPIFVPFSFVVVYSEMGLDISKFLSICSARQESLWAHQTVGEIWMDQNIFSEGNNITIVIKGLPAGTPNIFNLKSSCNASESNWLVKLSDGGWVDI